MFQVQIEGWFSAAHQLRMRDGAFEPLHGHNWRVVVTFEGGTLDGEDLLVDFTVAQPRLADLLRRMHDRCLNELPEFAARNPSAESVAVVVAEHMKADLPPGVRVQCVSVEEAPGCTARYLPA